MFFLIHCRILGLETRPYIVEPMHIFCWSPGWDTTPRRTVSPLSSVNDKAPAIIYHCIDCWDIGNDKCFRLLLWILVYSFNYLRYPPCRHCYWSFSGFQRIWFHLCMSPFHWYGLYDVQLAKLSSCTVLETFLLPSSIE